MSQSLEVNFEHRDTSGTLSTLTPTNSYFHFTRLFLHLHFTSSYFYQSSGRSVTTL